MLVLTHWVINLNQVRKLKGDALAPVTPDVTTVGLLYPSWLFGRSFVNVEPQELNNDSG